MANHSLPFTMAPVLFDLAQELAKDPKALSGNSMDRTSASYKMRFGMAETIRSRTIANMQNGYFSLNIDELTSNNLQRVLAVLVSYSSSVQKEVAVEHLTSVSLVSVNSESLFDELVQIFTDNQISFGVNPHGFMCRYEGLQEWTGSVSLYREGSSPARH